MFRSKVQWVELEERPTKYFFKLEKANYEKKLVREVKLQNEEVISNPVHVNKEIENFYRAMYTYLLTYPLHAKWHLRPHRTMYTSTINGENDDQCISTEPIKVLMTLLKVSSFPNWVMRNSNL